MDGAHLFSAPQVCAFAGVTFRQVDYWCRNGFLRPLTPARGSGTRRSFGRRDVQVAWVLGRLGAIGLCSPLPRVEMLYDAAELAGWFVVAPSGVVHVTDLSTLAEVLAGEPVAAVVDLAAAPLSGALPREEAVA